MEISFIDECGSTQEVLVNAIKSGRIAPPFALVAARQTAGTGSRGNEWISRSGNLHFSFAISASELPNDLPTSSASIYFAFLMREFLSELGSLVWLKWPNDFYLNEKKTGGVITTKICENFVCGIGLNLAAAPEFAGIITAVRSERVYKIFRKKNLVEANF